MTYFKTLIAVFGVVQLIGCTTTNVPEEVPDEPTKFSRYGNPDIYRQDGQTYEVMASAKDYDETGTASWYGHDFHKKRTSSGEPYDMYALTAAHKTLPLPTYVRVQNLENGREAIVKVNDRGPFYSDRIIDLSYGAAEQLGVVNQGTAKVRVEALGDTPTALYYIQAGAFASESHAQDLKNKLESSNPRTKVSIEKLKKHFVVCLGPLKNKTDMHIMKKLLKNRGIKGAFAFLR